MKESVEIVSPDAYILDARLKGHKEPILSLAVSPNGRLLASGGEDGVFIWDLQTKNLIGTLRHNRNVRGSTSCVTWLKGGESRDILCQGTGLGYISVWTRSVGDTSFGEVCARRLVKGAEIVCIKSDRDRAQHIRVAVGTRSRFVHVFTLDADVKLQPIFTTDLGNTVPIAIGFADNNAKDVIVFGLFDGQIYTLKGDDGELKSTIEIGGMFGSVAVSPSRNQFVVDGVINGFDLYQLDTGRWKRNFPTGAPIRRSSKQVAFGEDFKTVVGGSDHGAVYVFDRKRGVQLQVLRHADKGMVQTVTTYDTKEKSTIVSASSSNCDDISICIWNRKNKAETAKPLPGVELLAQLLTASVIILVVYFGYQSLMKWPSWQDIVVNIANTSRDHIADAMEAGDLADDSDLLTTGVYDYL